MKNSYIERSLSLPQGTIDAAAEAAKFDPELSALLALVTTFPWLVDVADHGFDPQYATLTLQIEALKISREKYREQ